VRDRELALREVPQHPVHLERPHDTAEETQGGNEVFHGDDRGRPEFDLLCRSGCERHEVTEALGKSGVERERASGPQELGELVVGERSEPVEITERPWSFLVERSGDVGAQDLGPLVEKDLPASVQGGIAEQGKVGGDEFHEPSARSVGAGEELLC